MSRRLGDILVRASVATRLLLAALLLVLLLLPLAGWGWLITFATRSPPSSTNACRPCSTW